MTSTPVKQGIIPFSTPIQSHNDSGYFGSNCKSSWSKLLHWISPIKEHPNKKKAVELKEYEKLCSNLFGASTSDSIPNLNELQSSKFVTQDDSAVVRDSIMHFQGSFTESNSDEDASKSSLPTFKFPNPKKKGIYLEMKSTGHLSQYKDYNSKCSFNFSSKLSTKETIFNKFKSKKVDFLKTLEEINCLVNIQFILSLLSNKDLTNVCCVSKKWREIVLNDKKANSRRKKYLEDLIEQKENLRNREIQLKGGSTVRCTGVFKNVLSDISCLSIPKKQPLVKQSSEKFNSFIEEGKNLKNGVLKKCPRCQFAAKIQNGDKYFCKHCNYSFCQRCLGPFTTDGHSCDKPEVLSLIGSKKSKKNLRRL